MHAINPLLLEANNAFKHKMATTGHCRQQTVCHTWQSDTLLTLNGRHCHMLSSLRRQTVPMIYGYLPRLITSILPCLNQPLRSPRTQHIVRLLCKYAEGRYLSFMRCSEHTSQSSLASAAAGIEISNGRRPVCNLVRRDLKHLRDCSGLL